MSLPSSNIFIGSKKATKAVPSQDSLPPEPEGEKPAKKRTAKKKSSANSNTKTNKQILKEQQERLADELCEYAYNRICDPKSDVITEDSLRKALINYKIKVGDDDQLIEDMLKQGHGEDFVSFDGFERVFKELKFKFDPEGGVIS